MMHAITIILSALVLCSGLDNNPIRNTKYGQIRGRVTTRLPGTEVEEFLGVPYAAPPIKALRFKRPTDPIQWNGIKNTTTVPPACPQPSWSYLSTHKPNFQLSNEDCLFMNIFVPRKTEEIMSNIVALLPAEIYFPQDSISNAFSEKGKYQGANIGSILDRVVSGNINIDDFIQDMTVSQTELKKGTKTVKRWASMNNRSLWVVKELQVIGKFTIRKDFQIGEKIPARMKTTNNGGECVVVRKRPVSGVSVKPASFWKFYDQMTAPKRLEFLQNFKSVRLQSSYFSEDLTPGPEATDDDEFTEKQEWFFKASQPFQQELATL